MKLKKDQKCQHLCWGIVRENLTKRKGDRLSEGDPGAIVRW
ncbi:hypothetical protein [Oxynema aestuarii]|nr:hypothetical protein [Oxynema aestuarii]